MGVKGLLGLLRDRNPDIVQTMDLSLLKGYRIAFDIAVLTYQFKSQYTNKVVAKLKLLTEDVDSVKCSQYMIKRILEMVSQSLIAGICPIMVFDGRPPALKNGTKKDRAAKSAKKRYRIEHLRRIGNGLKANAQYPITEEDIAFLKTFPKPIMTVEDLEDRLLTEVKACITITPDDHLKLQALFTALGVPWLIAESEAEKTCSIMARRRDVLAVYTIDSDALMYGCPIMINKIIYGVTARIPVPPKAQCYIFANCLAVTELTESQWLDWCIMLGTDFNPNSPGIGSEASYLLIKYFGSLNKIIAAKQTLTDAMAIRPSFKLNKIEKLINQIDPKVFNYDEVRCFLTWPVTYDKNVFKINIRERQFESAMPGLNELFGQEYFGTISELCKKTVERLRAVIPIMKH